MQTLMKGMNTGPGSYNYSLNLNVRKWPKGAYDIYIYEDYSNLNLKKTFELE
jgi:hypothetical protein